MVEQVAGMDAAEAEAILTFAGDVTGAQALILGGHSPPLFGTLIRWGCRAATSLIGGQRAERGAYDLVLVPELPSAQALGDLLYQVRRALTPTGRLVLRVAAAPVSGSALVLTRALRSEGFTALRSRAVGARLLLRADLPAFGGAAA